MTTSTCIICGRTTPGPDRPYCSFGCAAKDGVSIQQLLASSLAKLGATTTRSTPSPPPARTPPPAIPLAAPAPPPAGEKPPPAATTIPSEGGITKDGAAWWESGNRNDHLTRYLLRSGDTLILAGYGAGLRVERDALIVSEGHTHHPQQVLTTQGFDVACGFLHADLKGRDSLVYDVMEPLRGMVDGLVLRFLSAHTLHYGDLTRVHEIASGKFCKNLVW
jgi:hypothetical protein